MTEVREATIDDLEDILELSVAFNDKYYDIPFNRDKARRSIQMLIESPDTIFLLCGQSMIVGAAWTDPFRTWNVLVEVAWYSESKDGLKLLKAFEEYGYREGFDEVRMTTLHSNPGVEKVLERKGYVAIETSHRLKL